MKFGRLVATPAGTVLNPASRAFQELVEYVKPDFDLGDYAVRNMGHVDIRPGEQLSMYFRADLVDGEALRAAADYVRGQPNTMLVVQMFIPSSDENAREMIARVANGEGLLDRLVECAESFRTAVQPK